MGSIQPIALLEVRGRFLHAKRDAESPSECDAQIARVNEVAEDIEAEVITLL